MKTKTVKNQKPWGDGEDYDVYITSELNSFRKGAWKNQILKHFKNKSNLNILDVGTGPGFFATILSEEGHNVTAIDYSENMLNCARKNAEKLGVTPNFIKMDINDLDFENKSFVDSSFDVIVTRNVTWTLEFPEKVYYNLKRILKKGGKLLVYDANWHLHFFDNDICERVMEREYDYFKTYGTREVVAINNQDFFKTAPLTSIHRPTWDRDMLIKLGFNVNINDDIGQFVYEEWEQNLYGESPLFEVCAIK